MSQLICSTQSMTTPSTTSPLNSNSLANIDPEIAAAISAERQRQESHIELIASENFTYPSIIEAQGSVLTNKYAEGYPGRRYYNGCANMDAIMELAEAHNLFVIEDNAQAIGSNYTSKDGSKMKAGTIGHVASTSFFPSKNLGCYGDGGAIFTNDDDLAHTIRGIVNHGMYRRYYHDVVGVNSRLDSIQAVILNTKLPHLDSYNKARQNAARKYNAAFKGQENIITPVYKKTCDSICEECDCHVYHQYTLKVKDTDRDALAAHLNEQGIPCGVYYPVPLHSQKAYADERYNEEDFKVTNQLIKEVISLPMHTELDDEQIEFITSTLINFING